MSSRDDFEDFKDYTLDILTVLEKYNDMGMDSRYMIGQLIFLSLEMALHCFGKEQGKVFVKDMLNIKDRSLNENIQD